MNAQTSIKIGEALTAMGLVSGGDVTMALGAQRRMAAIGEAPRIGEIFVRMGLADWKDVEQALLATGSPISGVDSLDLPAKMLRRLGVMPAEIRDRRLYYSPVSPLLAREKRELQLAAQAAGHQIDEVVVHPRPREEVVHWLQRFTCVDHKLVQEEAGRLCVDAHDAPLMHRFIEHVFQDALQDRASDVHFERSSELVYCWISYRIDGVLRRRVSMTQRAMSAVCTRVKTIAGLDISESRRPQDGRSSVLYNGRNIDLRVSCVPDHDGETITVRMLDQSQVYKLSYVFRRHPYVEERMRALAAVRMKSGGIVLVTGPTGQGKSTTLSALMWAMPRTLLKIMTIEDPVENRIPFVHQTAVNAQAGVTYAALLRAFMRQDPDVLMLGEVRDEETAQEFLKGAETGHMMLSTEHTNDLASSVGRLMNLLPEELRRAAVFTMASALRAVLNQRLVPALCICASDDADAPARFKNLFGQLGYGPGMAWKLKKKEGCPRCDHTGYYGRELVVEAAFFPALHTLQLEMERHLMTGSPDQMLHCDGVQLYRRVDAVRTLLADGLIDAATAEAALDLSMVHDG